MATNNTPPKCDICGFTAYGGYESRRGDMEPETGYVEEQIVCNRCLHEEEVNAEDMEDWMADMAYDLGEGF